MGGLRSFFAFYECLIRNNELLEISIAQEIRYFFSQKHKFFTEKSKETKYKDLNFDKVFNKDINE